ncbi:MAG TPA: DNA alkylation repair protein [Bryobacteraceae bacterium]|nr:DNA alkylation repair protein [Bryobacteraceae bacterium]
MSAPVAAQLEAVRRRLQALADPVFREGVRWFFQGTADPYGVRTAAVRKLSGELYREVRGWPPAERNRFCGELWKSGKLEEGVLAVALYQRFRKQCGHCEFHLFEKWIDRFVRNWAHCDGVASFLIAGAIENEPELIAELMTWTDSRNLWKRRAAAVGLVWEGRKGRHTAEILQVAEALRADPEVMVQKGAGWVLKDAYRAKPKEIVAFLQSRAAQTPRLVLRIAAEKMTERDRAAVLGPRSRPLRRKDRNGTAR